MRFQENSTKRRSGSRSEAGSLNSLDVSLHGVRVEEGLQLTEHLLDSRRIAAVDEAVRAILHTEPIVFRLNLTAEQVLRRHSASRRRAPGDTEKAVAIPLLRVCS